MAAPRHDFAPAAGGLDAAYDYCAALVKARDPDRWLASLFAPAPARRSLLALYAFNAEVSRVRDLVSDPLPGEVRLQWWKDLLGGVARGEVSANPVAAGLLDTIERLRLPVKPLIDLIDARIFDLYDDPAPSLAWLDGYCAETSSAIIRLAEIVLAGGGETGDSRPAAKAGVAYAVTGLLRALPWHAARGQIFLPKDVLDRHGVARDDILRARGGPGVAAALADMRGHARAALAETRAAIGLAPASSMAAFLPVALVERYLDIMERPGFDPFRSLVDLPKWKKLIVLWRQARRASRGPP